MKIFLFLLLVVISCAVLIGCVDLTIPSIPTAPVLNPSLSFSETQFPAYTSFSPGFYLEVLIDPNTVTTGSLSAGCFLFEVTSNSASPRPMFGDALWFLGEERDVLSDANAIGFSNTFYHRRYWTYDNEDSQYIEDEIDIYWILGAATSQDALMVFQNMDTDRVFFLSKLVLSATVTKV